MKNKAPTINVTNTGIINTGSKPCNAFGSFSPYFLNTLTNQPTINPRINAPINPAFAWFAVYPKINAGTIPGRSDIEYAIPAANTAQAKLIAKSDNFEIAHQNWPQSNAFK